MKIMIDLDRVVFDCPSLVFNLANDFFTKTHFNKPLKYKIVDAEKAKKYFNTLFFVKLSHAKNLIQVDNSVEILQKWNKQGFNIHFVSYRPNFKSLQKSTVEWLEQNNISYNKLIFACTNKPRYCKLFNFDVMIDDTLENCKGAKRLGIKPIWLRNYHNSTHNDFSESIFNTYSWNEVDEYVQKLNTTMQNKTSEEIEKI